MRIPGIMLAASASGSGKTAAACALMAGFRQMGKKVRGCKCGPDYIDPMFHREVLGVESENLDLFFCREDELAQRYESHGRGADIVVTEGVMGYYDGMALHSVKGSAYEIARVLGMPVILVVPCRGMGVSVLAQLKGFLEFRRDHSIRGILLNRISPALYPRMRDMIHQGLREMGRGEIRVVGYLPEDESLQFESRHLGLVTPEETAGLRERLDRAGELVSRTVDLELLLQIAGSAEELV